MSERGGARGWLLAAFLFVTALILTQALRSRDAGTPAVPSPGTPPTAGRQVTDVDSSKGGPPAVAGAQDTLTEHERSSGTVDPPPGARPAPGATGGPATAPVPRVEPAPAEKVAPGRPAGGAAPTPAAAADARDRDAAAGTIIGQAETARTGPTSIAEEEGDVLSPTGAGGGGGGGGASRPPTAVHMLAGADAAGIGDRVTVRIEIVGATDVASVPFHVRFDPSVLRYEGGTEGPFLSGDGAQTAFFAAPTNAGDAVIVGLSRLGPVPGMDGGGELCTLEFTAVGPGNAALRFAREKVRGPDNRILPAAFEPVDLVVR